MSPFNVALPLVQASEGNFYGTTFYGGANGSGGATGYGTVFKITASGTLTSLYSFGFTPDGSNPESGLIQGSDGSLYGTTTYGGANNYGTVFKINLSGTFTHLYTFKGSDGKYPDGALVQASDGNLYGVTVGGGVYGWGTVFKITTAGALTTLHSFNESDDSNPRGALIQASDGSLYGVTQQGGTNNTGTIFKITTSGAFTTLYTFGPPPNGAYGGGPIGNLIQAADGNLYGTETDYDGGMVFKVTTAGVFTTLHSFTSGSDGGYPVAGLIQGSDSSLYGTTTFGGANNYGTVFRITPAGALTTLCSSTGSEGSLSSLVQAKDGYLYGIGAAAYGVIYRLSGIYPIPVIVSLSPTSRDASGPAFTLSVKGSSFQPFSTVHWNGTPLSATFVSTSSLKAAIPASLIASPGKATVTVVTGAGGGTSNSKPFTILLTTLKFTSATLTKDSTTGAYTATISLKNVGYLSASNVAITKASLGPATTSTTLPVSLETIAAGATASTSLSFPGSAGASGAVVTLTVSGTFTGGKFAGSLKVTLP